MKHIPIFFTFDNNYVIPAAVAFFSLLNTAKDDVYYKMFVLHSDITQESQNLLLDIVKKIPKGDLVFIDTNNFLLDEWLQGNFEGHNRKKQFNVNTILKCFGAKFLKQYDKIIYSDVDIVVLEDISELYDINLEEKYIGAVKNPFMIWDKNELSHLSKENYEKYKNTYFGGGIWVLNLKKIREDNLEEKMLKIINDDSITKRWPDQDIMNLACDNKVEFIPLNYIFLPYLYERIKKSNFKSHYSRDELYDSIISPKILHFAGLKPWCTNIEYSQIWWAIFDYLQLPKTSIFTSIPKDSSIDKLQKKYKKYKKLFNIFLTITIAMLLFLIINIIL